MRSTYLSTSVLMVLISLVLASCREGLVPADRVLDDSGVKLTVSVDPDDEGGLWIVAEARNQHAETIRYTATCGNADMDFRFFDRDGEEIRVTNPCEPEPARGCPTLFGPLAPGETARSRAWFGGTMWNGCMGTPAPAGEYRVSVSFTFFEDIEFGADEVEASGAFSWSP